MSENLTYDSESQTSQASPRAGHPPLIELADRVNAALQPHAACRGGCSDCCSMPR